MRNRCGNFELKRLRINITHGRQKPAENDAYLAPVLAMAGGSRVDFRQLDGHSIHVGIKRAASIFARWICILCA